MQFNSASLQDTNALAQALAPDLRAGDCVLLYGPVGAGKSAFARAVIDTRLRACNRAEHIPSPSFTLIQSYDLADYALLHVDLYRLNSTEELEELDLDSGFETAITLLEWPEKLGPYTPQVALHIHFTIGADDDSRIMRLTAQGARAKTLLNRLAHA